MIAAEQYNVFCRCQGRYVDEDRCDCCDSDWGYGDDDYEEPPLYKAGELEAMTPDQLIAERNRQNRIHDLAVDRCEEINSPTIETAAARANLVIRELRARGLNPFAEKPERP